MQDFSSFKFDDREDLFAAVLGTSSNHWYYTTSAEFSQEREKVINLMKEKRFDVLPSSGKTGKIEFYVSFKDWGTFVDETIFQNRIDPQIDVIYYLTHARDMIRLMKENKRYFYFLGNHKDILGLITIADFNDKQFYFWLYKKIVKLEKGIAEFIQNKVDYPDIVEAIEQRCKLETKDNNYFSSVYKRYLEDAKKGLDTEIVEYLYLGQLCELVKDFGLDKELGLTKNKFESGLRNVFEIRRKVAHPTRSILRSPKDLEDLYKGIEKIESLTDLINEYKKVQKTG